MECLQQFFLGFQKEFLEKRNSGRNNRRKTEGIQGKTIAKLLKEFFKKLVELLLEDLLRKLYKELRSSIENS